MLVTPVEESKSPPPRARWTSCCVETDRQAVVYIGQMIFSAGIITLCAVMLVNSEGDCNKSSPYISLLSFLAGKVLATVVSSSQ